MLVIRRITIGSWGINCYAISDKDGKCVLIDPGEDPVAIDEELVMPNRLCPIAMIATHGHLDHVGGAKYYNEKYSAPLYIHGADVELANNATYWAGVLGTHGITDPEKIERMGEGIATIDNFGFKIIHTPGHTIGGICIYLEENGAVFTGDTLFFHSIGRSDRIGLDTGGQDILVESIKSRLFKLPDETIVFPGHGRSTTIGHERQQNPFLI
jgi:glyoxylase-like metal-dependent hydrolase (beta-lactamase superfamily II)